MEVYFADWAVPDSEDDVLGIDSVLFGDILHILVVATYILDIVVGDVRPTPRLLAMILSDSNNSMAACLPRETPFNFFDAVCTYRSAGFVPLYLLDDSTDDSQPPLVGQFIGVLDLGPPRYDISLHGTY
jgi:hypothetical protein